MTNPYVSEGSPRPRRRVNLVGSGALVLTVSGLALIIVSGSLDPGASVLLVAGVVGAVGVLLPGREKVTSVIALSLLICWYVLVPVGIFVAVFILLTG